MSTELAAVVSMGAVPLGHFTAAGQTAVRLPVPSCTTLKIRLHTPPVGAVKVKVQLPVRVTFCLLPLFQTMVFSVPELPLSYSELKAAALLISNFCAGLVVPKPKLPLSKTTNLSMPAV